MDKRSIFMRLQLSQNRFGCHVKRRANIQKFFAYFSKTTREAFFFEKKKQKTFTPLASAYS